MQSIDAVLRQADLLEVLPDVFMPVASIGISSH
jgi:hypothetical protein